jgi:integrase
MRQSTKKARQGLLNVAEAAALIQLRNDSPQAWRDALLMCLLLEHGLCASEVASLTVANIDLAQGELRFCRPKSKAQNTSGRSMN